MIVQVFLTAFHLGDRASVVERPVEVPELRASRDNRATLLESVFQHGQNDVQPVGGCYSVSIGDVIDLRLAGLGAWRVASGGFVKLAMAEDPTALIGPAAVDAGYARATTPEIRWKTEPGGTVWK